MGIKGVYGEIGPGTRTALSKLAVEKREQHQTNLRIAVDFSIWQHQVQLGKGGTNADLRTLFFRLLRFLRLSIEPLFVFDGPHKPPFKRNKKTNVSGGSALQLAAREFFDLLGYPYITAPGEAEAECALLQREGVVDAVLSEDVDTLMFGCSTHLRLWGSEDRKTKGGTATHVDVHRASEIKSGPSGLDREGLILIALMNGGDYLPAGIPNCGVKIACEAARAGFGHDLQKINRNDTAALRMWRDRLQHELHTNESNYFRTKHRTLEIPETFPDKAVLYYYSSPVVSTSQQVEKYRRELVWKEPNIKRLREACMVSFEWSGAAGFCHFTRNIAPALVGWRLANGVYKTNSYDDIDIQSALEECLVKTISGSRTHSSTDNIPELRIAYIPQEIIGMSLDEVAKEDLASVHNHTASYSDDEQNTEPMEARETIDPTETTKKSTVLPYDPSKIEKQWFPEAYVKLGVPISYAKWVSESQDPKKFATRKARAKAKEKEAMPHGAMEKYLMVKKVGIEINQDPKPVQEHKANPSHSNNVLSSFNPSLDRNLTELEFSSTSCTYTTRQAVPRTKSSTNKVVKAISTLARHTRVTKPNSGISTSAKMINVETTDKENSTWRPEGMYSSSGDTPLKHKKPPLLQQELSFKTSVDERLGIAELTTQSVVSTLHDLENSESVHSSIEMNDSDRCNDSTSGIETLSSQNHFKPRPNGNQWRFMDDEDSLYDTPPPKKNSVVYVDLTLS